MRNDTLIVLTNDDGIDSPGLLAAAAALSELGWVMVVAPREQQSGMGRSMPYHVDGIIHKRVKLVNDEAWETYAVGGTPAQAVQHAIYELAERRPDLVVSGINFGENVGSGVTISGTVGAAMEAASYGIPALAVSLETLPEYHKSHSSDIDFATAAYFTAFFAARLLRIPRVPDVDLLKLEVPANATPETPWRVVRQSRHSYYVPTAPDRVDLSHPGKLGYAINPDLSAAEPDSDIGAIAFQHVVAVTPMSLDLTSRVALAEFDAALRGSGEEPGG